MCSGYQGHAELAANHICRVRQDAALRQSLPHISERCLQPVLTNAGLQNGITYDYNTIYNMTDNTYEPFYITELAFCGGNTLLPDGRAFIVGGKPPSLLTH